MSPSAETYTQEVAIEDSLYRCVSFAAGWVVEQNRPSSALFHNPDFSTDMVSIAQTPQYTLARFNENCGVALFSYIIAKELGFIARQEIDPEFPENKAHANVYHDQGSDKSRKKRAQKLAQACAVPIQPKFPPQ